LYTGQTILSQLMDYVPEHAFARCVQSYSGDFRIRSFSCLDQFLCMTFAQLTGRESLRDIEVCLRAQQPKLYHAGIRGTVSRSTLADANETRDWHIYADFAQILIRHARELYANDDFALELKQTVYAFDSTTIDLCLSLFPWARYQERHGAVKLHTLIDLKGNIPCFIHFTNGKVHDVEVMDELSVEPGAFYVLDRGYVDFERLYALAQHMAYFVIRAKGNLTYHRYICRPVDRETGLRCDQTITLRRSQSRRDYPVPLRRVSYCDLESARRLVFLSNNFVLPALLITRLYRYRWQIELFFKWIKQHLRIKAFYGTSENAVKTQVWIAVSSYVLIAIIRKRLGLERSISEILQILGTAIFDKEPLYQLLTRTIPQKVEDGSCNQLRLFNF
jgi:hypothetical protein